MSRTVRIGCWTGLRTKSFYSRSFLLHVVQIANHQYPAYYCCGCRYISCNCLHMRTRRFLHLKSFLFLHCIFPVGKSIFRESWVCIRWSKHSALKCFRASMATGRISSLVMMQPLKSFKPFPVCSLIRIVSSTTPSSVSLVHCSTHDKSVHYLFSAPQSRSQQQTEILIYFLEKLAPVNDISVLWIFSPQMIINKQ